MRRFYYDIPLTKFLLNHVRTTSLGNPDSSYTIKKEREKLLWMNHVKNSSGSATL